MKAKKATKKEKLLSIQTMMRRARAMEDAAKMMLEHVQERERTAESVIQAALISVLDACAAVNEASEKVHTSRRNLQILADAETTRRAKANGGYSPAHAARSVPPRD